MIEIFFGLDSSSPKNPRAEVGTEVILVFLSAAIDNVQDTLVAKYIKLSSNNNQAVLPTCCHFNYAQDAFFWITRSSRVMTVVRTRKR